MPDEYALVLTSDLAVPEAVRRRVQDRDALDGLARQSGLDRIDLFSPHPDYATVPYFKDGPPPALIAEFAATSIAALQSLADSDAFRAVVRDHSAWRAGLFRIVREPIAGATHADERTAPVSFVVRYFPPVEDAAQFARHYVTNHPPLLARFPKIRNVICYLPQEAKISGVQPDDTVIRNEVVFDSIADLIAALRSPILSELRADSATFPSFGRSTHHAMVRTASMVKTA